MNRFWWPAAGVAAAGLALVAASLVPVQQPVSFAQPDDDRARVAVVCPIVAGDANPIHWDEDIAKLAGLPDVIAHGMLTMGLGAGFASSWSGDPGAVTRYAVRLSAPAIVSAAEGCDIEFSGRIKSLDPATRSGVVIVAAKSDGKKIFGLATLEMRFR